jgi:hypothetical protein
MKYALTIGQLAFGIGLFLCDTLPTYAHGGGLDAYGCHHNREGWRDHCQRGALAGDRLGSKDEVLRKRRADKRDLETKSEKINDSNLSKVREVTQACRLLFAGSFHCPVSLQFGRQLRPGRRTE